MVPRREKNRRWPITLWFMSVLLLSGSPVCGVTARVRGTVTDAKGNPLPKVQIVFETDQVKGRSQGTTIGKVKTQENGNYSFPFLDVGSWKIYAETEGHLVLKMDVLSVDSEGYVWMEDDNIKITRSQSNIPAIPVRPQGQGSVARGKCVVNFVMVPEEEHSPGNEELLGLLDEMLPVQQDVIWYNIGVDAFNNDNKAEAAQAFEKSIEANKMNSDAHKMLGYTLVGLGKHKEAIPHFETYLTLEKGPEAQEVAAILEQLRGLAGR